jgi:hypothetical protein
MVIRKEIGQKLTQNRKDYRANGEPFELLVDRNTGNKNSGGKQSVSEFAPENRRRFVKTI